MGHLPSDVAAIEAELREAVGSREPGLGSFLSRDDGGGDRVVPKSPAKGAHGVRVPSYQPSLGLWAFGEKPILP